MKLYQKNYYEFNFLHFNKKPAENHGIKISYSAFYHIKKMINK
jgi:hypothetical protein